MKFTEGNEVYEGGRGLVISDQNGASFAADTRRRNAMARQAAAATPKGRGRRPRLQRRQRLQRSAVSRHFLGLALP